jgi:hypothetical protein
MHNAPKYGKISEPTRHFSTVRIDPQIADELTGESPNSWHPRNAAVLWTTQFKSPTVCWAIRYASVCPVENVPRVSRRIVRSRPRSHRLAGRL